MSNLRFFLSEFTSARFALATITWFIVSFLAVAHALASPYGLSAGQHDRWSAGSTDTVALAVPERSLFTVEALSDDDHEASLLVEIESAVEPVAHWLSAAAVLAPSGSHAVRITRADGEPLGAYQLRVAIAIWPLEPWKDGQDDTSGDGKGTTNHDDDEEEVVIPRGPGGLSIAWKDGAGNTGGDDGGTTNHDDDEEEVVIPRGPGGGLLDAATRRALCSTDSAPGFVCARVLPVNSPGRVEPTAHGMWSFRLAQRSTVRLLTESGATLTVFDDRGRRLEGTRLRSIDDTRVTFTLPAGRYFVRLSPEAIQSTRLRVAR